MQDRFAVRMSDPKARADSRLLGDFVGIYCRGKHRDAARAPLRSDGVVLGIYGRTAPVVCDGCAELLAYAEQRRAFCPKDPKPFCNTCETHCYKPAMREYMRDVMRYAGPRSIFHGYAIQGVRHLIDSRKAHTRAGAQSAADDEG